MGKINTLVVALLMMSTSFLKSQKEKISLNILCKQQYCGGARPTQQMIEDAEKSKAYANKMLVIISDKFKVDSAKTNEKGQLIIKIKKGTYKIYETWKYYKTGPNNEAASKFDKDCIKAEWERPIYIISKTSKKTNIDIGSEIRIMCPWTVPCLTQPNMPPLPE